MICLPQRVVLGSQELLHERDRFQDPRFAVLLEHQKVFITTDQEVDLGSLGECKQLYQFAIQIHPIYLLFFRITSPRRSSRSYGYATTSSDRPAKK